MAAVVPAACYNIKKKILRENVMKHIYEAPCAWLALFASRDLLMASDEITPGGPGSGGDNFWSEDGTIHLPPVPLG